VYHRPASGPKNTLRHPADLQVITPLSLQNERTNGKRCLWSQKGQNVDA